MDGGRLSLCVLCVLCGGAVEIPRIHAPAHPDLLRAFAVYQTHRTGPTNDLSGPPPDPVGTGFGRGFLSPSCPALATIPAPSTPSAKPRPARLFSFARTHPHHSPGFPCI